MLADKIADHLRVDGPGSASNPAIHALTPRAGGRLAKSVSYHIEIIATSSDQTKLGLDLNHGPNGAVSRLHSSPIGLTQLTANNAMLLVGDAGSAVVGEYLHPILKCQSNDVNPCWAVVNVYEMRKPF
jgi:hypothetical protein